MTAFRANVRVVVKPTINDPEGLTIANALRTLGFDSVESVRAGKYMEIKIDQDTESDAARQVEAMCDKLLANPVIEEYRFELEKAD